MGDIGSRGLDAHHAAARSGGRPLGGGGALAAVGHGARYCRSAVQKWEEVWAAAMRAKPPATAMAASDRLSPMVEQAPYTP